MPLSSFLRCKTVIESLVPVFKIYIMSGDSLGSLGPGVVEVTISFLLKVGSKEVA